jgi:hypothetical protein
MLTELFSYKENPLQYKPFEIKRDIEGSAVDFIYFNNYARVEWSVAPSHFFIFIMNDTYNLVKKIVFNLHLKTLKPYISYISFSIYLLNVLKDTNLEL